MLALTVAVVLAALLSLAFDTTRWIGVVGLALLFLVLFYRYPLFCTALFPALFLFGGVALYFTRCHKRSTSHDLPKLLDRRN